MPVVQTKSATTSGLKSSAPRRSRQAKNISAKKISLTRKPDDLTLEEWQAELRRNLSLTQKFRLEHGENLTNEKPSPFFSVRNLDSQRTYDLEIRGLRPHDNYCSCPDYQINTLGTCKHIEFSLRTLSRKPTYKHTLRQFTAPLVSEVIVQYANQRQIIFRPAAGSNGEVLQIAKKYFDWDGTSFVLRKNANEKFADFAAELGNLKVLLRIREDVIEFLARLRDRTSLAQRVNQLFSTGSDSEIWKNLLKAELYSYQKDGALFAAANGRSIIADEMGLGKTIQAIAAAEILSKVVGIERVLIVAPTSLKHQWKSEIGKFSGQSAEVIEGFSTRRQELMRTDTFFKITNYDVVRRDLESLNAWKPELIILDEAQRIKNWKTSTAQNVKRLKSEYCVVLTGTPLENRVEELHSLVEFVDRFHFGPLFRFLSKHQQVDEDGKVTGYRNLNRINVSLKGLLLRRNKSKVLTQLPPRIDKTFFVPMTKEQTAIHDEYANVVAQIVAKWKRHRFLSDSDQKRMMAALQFMRMACNSTFLVDRTTRHQNKITELFKLIADVFETEGSKIVIFSQWLRTHELIIECATGRQLEYAYFHGSLESAQRRKVIEKFMTDPNCRLFLSTDAGGVGLNLQKANVVINMDQPWNPAILEQRIGRSHRLGQKQPVQVFNLVSQGTIEEGMLKTLAFKKSLFSGILDGGQNEIFLGGSRLTKFMQSVEEATNAVPPSMGQEDISISEKLNQQTIRPRTDQSIMSSNEKGNNGSVKPPQVSDSIDPWSPLLQLGLQLLQSLAPTPHSTTTSAEKPKGPLMMLERDQKTGETYFKIPAPSAIKIQKFASALQELLSGPENN